MIRPGVSKGRDTICAVKIRAVTLGLDLPAPTVEGAPFATAATFLTQARSTFADAGVEVQTTRLAGADLAPLLGTVGLATWAKQTEDAARAAGIEYLSFGRL